MDLFKAATTNLLRAEKAAGVKHHVALSIVGIDKAAAGYCAGKLAQEKLVSGGEMPWTILRPTQFHEFVSQVLKAMRSGTLIPAAGAAVGRQTFREWLETET